jgi:hypothetical protein
MVLRIFQISKILFLTQIQGLVLRKILFLHDSEGFTYQHPAQAAGSVPQCSITCRPGCEDELVRRLF